MEPVFSTKRVVDQPSTEFSERSAKGYHKHKAEIQSRLKAERANERALNRALANAEAEQRRRHRQEKHEALMEAKNEVRVSFGAAMLHKREALGLSLDEMAYILGLNRDTYASMEVGIGNLFFDFAVKVMKLLQIRCEHFFDMVDVDDQRTKMALAVDQQAHQVDHDMAKLERQMAALKERKTLIARVKGDRS